MNRSKTWSVIKDVLTWALVVITVLMVIVTLILSAVDGDNKKIFGVRMMTVLSDSMKATDFKAGDIIFVKDVDPSTLEVGDIVAYRAKSGDNKGSIVTHKIKELTVDDDGNPGFVTYGTTTGVVDDDVVTYWDIVGKYTGKLPGIGYFFNYLKEHKAFTYIVFVLLPFSLLIGSQAVNSVKLFKQYKSEQKTEIDVERDRLAAEIEETHRLKEELLKMKAELASGRAPTPDESAKVELEPTESAPETESAPVAEAEDGEPTESKADEEKVEVEAAAPVELVSEAVSEPCEEHFKSDVKEEKPENNVPTSDDDTATEDLHSENEAINIAPSAEEVKAARKAEMKKDLKTVEKEIMRLMEQHKAKKAAYATAEGEEKAEIYATLAETEKTAKALMSLRNKIKDQLDSM